MKIKKSVNKVSSLNLINRLEFAPIDFLDDEPRDGQETPQSKLLKKQFTMNSPNMMGKLASLNAQDDFAVASDPVTAMTNTNTSKKFESPQRLGNEDSPLLSGLKESVLKEEKPKTHVPNQPSRFGQSSIEAQAEVRQSVRPSGVKKGLHDIQERMSKFETSTSRNDTKQNYMQILTENPNDKNGKLNLFSDF